MGLKEYEITVPGRREHKTTMQLSDADAERLGVLGQHIGASSSAKAATSSEQKPAARKAAARKAATSKARTPRNKAVKPAETKTETKSDGVTDPTSSEA